MTATSALVLSGSIGMGHDSVATACQAAFESPACAQHPIPTGR